MSTSRKLRAILAKHRRSARKATSTEAAREEPEPEPTEHSTAEMPATTQRGTVTARSALTVAQFVCFCSRQCCPPSRGELAGYQQEPHAVSWTTFTTP